MNWVIKDSIRNGYVTFNIGDEVVVFRRKKNGYPKLDDNKRYFVYEIENDCLLIRVHSTDGIGWMSPIKIHKSYLITKSALRDIKINQILK